MNSVKFPSIHTHFWLPVMQFGLWVLGLWKSKRWDEQIKIDCDEIPKFQFCPKFFPKLRIGTLIDEFGVTNLGLLPQRLRIRAL